MFLPKVDTIRMEVLFMSKSKLFKRKNAFNIFIFLGVVITLSLVIYFTNVSINSTYQVEGNSNEVAQGGFESELNVNEKSIDNALEVKEEEKDSSLKKDLADNSTIANNDNKTEVTNNESKETSNKVDETLNKVEDDTLAKGEETSEVSSSSPVTFVSPIDKGSLIREYTTDTIYSKTLNTWRTREGIDLKAENGTPVLAILDGVVEKIDNDLTEKGQYIVIKHDNGFKSVYTNLDEEVKVVNGQQVRKGEIIASVGNSSGNYSNEDYGSHLNFIMYLNNEEVNPADYIKFN